MPKFVKKSCTAQTSISSYFGGGRSGKSGKSGTPSHNKHKLGGKHKPPDEEHFGIPVKRARLSLHVEEDADAQAASCHSTQAPPPSSHRCGGLSSITLEKLKTFSCLAGPSEPGEAGGKIPQNLEKGGKRSVSPKVRDDEKICNEGLKQREEEEEEQRDEEEEDEEQGGAAMSRKKTLGLRSTQFAKPGGRRAAESSPPSDSAASCRRPKVVHTPLEQQVIELKQQHQGALLAVECGYKYRFFGEDAEIAAKELNIYCHQDHNFMTCSIPTHRLFVHVRRLVSRGHKVGVVKQTETSAIKASGTNRNALFSRQLSALYTKSTLVGEDVNPVCFSGDVDQDVGGGPSESFLLSLSESREPGKQLTLGLVAVQPSTGDVLFDCFSDGASRSELEARILKINPVEILVPSNLSEHTHRLLQSLANASPQADDLVRIETRDRALFDFPTAMNAVTNFYCHTQNTASRSLSSVVALESPVICCLGPLIQYLQEFNLERVLLNDSSFRRLSSGSEGLVLGAATLRNLEILSNQTDGGVRGSLLWVLDHTRTPFGRRLMRAWVSQPLTDAQSIAARQRAVCEILESDSSTLTSVRSLLTHLPDLERGVCSIYHKKCSTQEFFLICSALCRLGAELQALLPAVQSQLGSPLLQELLLATPELLGPAQNFLKVLDEKAAKSGDKKELFQDLSGFPLLQERREQIRTVLGQIQDHRKDVRVTLRAPALDYTCVSGQEFLIEVKNSMSSVVPPDWVKISSTKTVSRFHSSFLVEHYRRLLQLREELLLDSEKEWTDFLHRFGEHYHTMKRAISHLATLDCLFSLAEVAKQGDYCRPEVCEDQRQIMIRDGRHPAIDLLLGENNQYVPNHTQLQGEGRRTMIVTGPNMGGKSSYIRQVALVCVMAQMGSYVPASEARLGILDGIYTRMGASDNIYKGRSTFMEELTEASAIVARATERSLVILDELGRGTSTHDGIAIAHATLEHFITDVRSLTLFVTHYPPLCELERSYPQHVANYHMAFLLNEPDMGTGTEDSEVQPEFITFLYQLTEGAAGRSYGLNVARLAEVPDPVLQTAARKARELESAVDARRKNKRLLAGLWKVVDRESLMDWMKIHS